MIVRIKYIDSCIISEQTDVIAKPTKIDAIGFLVKETKDYITIARERIRGEWRGQVSIPKVAILNVD